MCRSSLVLTRQPKKIRAEETQANKKPLDRLMKVTNDARTPALPSDSNSDPDLKRSIVIRNLPEPQCTNSVEKVFHDFSAVTEMLSCLDVECLPITTYRMGTFSYVNRASGKRESVYAKNVNTLQPNLTKMTV
ncbi:hypothetical protein Y032_0235g3186 [Ancylostoma ceylanicum]|uniref:Uncharacterized protein n=1 Tax=Ancylostoma ceylanicum TaxID=53326 RepID=A0A016SF04_9BILA|nr:hypothetical protein Y032_0235g3186 [Ancylostoma ceylanicum]